MLLLHRSKLLNDDRNDAIILLITSCSVTGSISRLGSDYITTRVCRQIASRHCRQSPESPVARIACRHC